MKKQFLLFILTPIVIAACSKRDQAIPGNPDNKVITPSSSITGNGVVVLENRTISPFDSIVYNGVGSLYFTQGSSIFASVEAESNIAPLITTEVRRNTLFVGVQNNTSIQPTKPIKINAGAPALYKFFVGGAGVANSTGPINTSSLLTEVSGAGSLELKGAATQLSSALSGSGQQKTSDLVANEVTITASGTSVGYVQVKNKLTASLSGVSTVYYKGNPVVTANVSFLSKLIKQ